MKPETSHPFLPSFSPVRPDSNAPLEERLHASEELLRRVMDSSLDCIKILDLDGRLLWMNQGALRGLETTDYSVYHNTQWLDFWTGEDRSAAKGALTDALAKGVGRFTGQCVTAKGGKKCWEINVTPILDAAEVPEKFLCVSRDITERNATVRALDRAKARYHSLFENSLDGIFQIGPNDTVHTANAALAKLLGFRSAEELMREWPHFASESFFDPVCRMEFLGLITTQPVVRAFEYQLRRRDDSQTWVSVSARALRDPQGHFIGYEGNMKDISARRNSEQLIREQANFINRAHNSITVTDLDGRFTFWNKGAERIFGYTAAEALGQAPTDFPGIHVAQLLKIGRIVLEKGEWRGEISLNTKAGNTIVIDAHFSLIRDEAGVPTARLCIASDITEKKQLEEISFHAQRLEGVGMLAAGIAHDLNNVLAPILLAVPMLTDKVADPGARRLLAMMGKSAERGAGLVRQILAFAHQTDSGTKELQIKHLLRDLSSVVEETFPKSLDFKEEFASDLSIIEGNPTQLHQVLLNLCVNARDAMPEGGRLRFSAENRLLTTAEAHTIEGGRSGAFVLLQVQDTGTGIPPEVLARIWEPFFTTKGPGKGTGLGLPTVRGIVEKHRGFVTIDTTPGRGTTFGVWLPAMEKPQEGTTPAIPAQVARGNGELILVVDDEISIRDLVKAALTIKGYRVLIADDGAEAVAMYTGSQSAISLVITDLNMPNLDGRALVHSIRQINPEMKILTMSGSPANLPAGPDKSGNQVSFIAKPFSVEAILAQVQDLLKVTTAKHS